MQLRGPVLALSVVLAASACAQLEGASSGGNYPRRPVEMIIPFAAGGTADLAPRAVAPCFEKRLGKPLVIVNKEGGGTTIGTGEVLGEPADGYTLGLGTTGSVNVSPRLVPDAGYTEKDIEPVGVMMATQGFIFGPKGGKYRTASQLIDAAKRNPGKVTMGTAGAATLAHVELLRLEKLHNVDFKEVPYGGSGELFPALLGGQIDAAWLDSAATVRKLVESGKAVPLIAPSAKRIPFLPDTPTLGELGYDDIVYSDVNYYVFTPKGLPDDVGQKLEDTLQKCLQEPGVRDRIGKEYIPEKFIGRTRASSIVKKTADALGPVLSDVKPN